MTISCAKALKVGLFSAAFALVGPLQAGADGTNARGSNSAGEDIPTFAAYESQCRGNATEECTTLFNHGAEYANEAMSHGACDFTAFWDERDGLNDPNLALKNWDIAIGELIDEGACSA